MKDIEYIVNLGFSGADLAQALWIGLLISLCISKYLRLWGAIFLAFVIDRTWPFLDMSFNGYEGDAIKSAIWNTMTNIPGDAFFYLIRYLGIALIVMIGYKIRLLFHVKMGADHSGKVFS